MKRKFVPFLFLFSIVSIQADPIHAQEEKKPVQEKVWSRYDFVPGDKIIFEDNLQGEVNGEAPSKWGLQYGRAEIAEYGGEKVIYLIEDGTAISPLMKTEHYLPDLFTVEFDMFTEWSAYYYEARLEGIGSIGIGRGVISAYSFEGTIPQEEESYENRWHHVAIAFNKRSLKVYFNENRILNIPNISEKPTAFGIALFQTGGYEKYFIKNVRIAAGGRGLYDQVMTEGKIVTRGILFDVGKATIKPQSMGVINEVAKLLKEKADLKFSIEGHTDSDGDDAFNQKLSEQRAEAVKAEFVKAGIDAARLQTKGWGETKPIDPNATPEGKANNRRVEFVKL